MSERAKLLRAMWEAPLPDMSQAGWNRVYAANMLAAIEAAGCEVWPKEWTDEMRAAWQDAKDSGTVDPLNAAYAASPYAPEAPDA